MAVISDLQIAQYAQGAGFRSNALTIAIAVSLAESGGNTTATNLNTNGTTDYGLWQVNSVHSQYSPALLLTPAYNAKAAFELSKNGSNWSPWVTYNTGAYKQFLPRAQAVTGGTPVPVSSSTVDQIFTQRGLWKWYSSSVTNPFNGTSERGADYAAAWGTPVGCIVGGKVVRIEHNNNSIGDVVEVQSADTSVVLYQHIRTRVATGQYVSTGDVIGTEDGLPVDQYSTGPHIECRYSPPGMYVFSKGSWNNGWVDPVPFFSSIGRKPATGPGGSVSGGFFPGIPGVVSTGPANTYIPLSEQVHQTLVNAPGFYGMALAIDEAEQFPGWIDLTTQQTTTISTPDVPFVGSVPIGSVNTPDVNGIARSVGATISDNFIPFAIRSGLVLMGSVLVLALLVKPIASSGAIELLGV